jgi:phosphoglycolate phosphatase-like HAD superfamily hydrolase
VIADFARKKDFFVGIDSDGCAFDTMEVKHKECFIPNIVGSYGLAAVSKYAREAAEFINLYSQWRGINRFPGLIMALDLLRQRPEVGGRGFEVPHLPKTREWIAKETKLGNPALAKAVQETGDPELALLLDWSKSVNDSVEKVIKQVPPFPFVSESLDKLAPAADLVVCSATPGEALTREWQEHGIDRSIASICGQEVGTKKEILTVTREYPAEQSLMIGDAPGDLAAARANNVLFFPIIPGREEESWRRFYDEAVDRFLNRKFAGSYEDELVLEFEASLPSTPPWKTV